MSKIIKIINATIKSENTSEIKNRKKIIELIKNMNFYQLEEQLSFFKEKLKEEEEKVKKYSRQTFANDIEKYKIYIEEIQKEIEIRQ